MKKRFLISTTILALILSLSILFVSVYAAVNQSISVNNVISFKGNTRNLKFEIDGVVTGTTNDEASILQKHWEYDYDKQGITNEQWNVGNITFATEGKTIDQINITYSFTIKNLSKEDKIIVCFDGPGELIAGLNKNYYKADLIDGVETTPVSINNNENVTIDGENSVVLKLILTLERIEDFNCNEEINFSLNFKPYEE